MAKSNARAALTDRIFGKIDRHIKTYAEMLKVSYEFETDPDEVRRLPLAAGFRGGQ